MDEFFRTPMGRTFFEHTVPELVRQLARLNDNLEKDREQRARIHSHRAGTAIDVPICGCTGEQLERGEYCAMEICPNRPRIWGRR